MAEAGEAGVKKQQSPAWREVWVFEFASTHAPDEIDESDHDCRVDRDSGEAGNVGVNFT